MIYDHNYSLEEKKERKLDNRGGSPKSTQQYTISYRLRTHLYRQYIFFASIRNIFFGGE